MIVRNIVVLLWLGCSFALQAAVSSPERKLPAGSTIGIMLLDFNYLHLLAGGVSEYSHELSQKAQQRLRAQIEYQMGKNNRRSVQIDPKTIHPDSVYRIRQLFELVSRNISKFVTSSDNPFPGAQKQFSYQLQPL